MGGGMGQSISQQTVIENGRQKNDYEKDLNRSKWKLNDRGDRRILGSTYR